jgi:hypothetical protein
MDLENKKWSDFKKTMKEAPGTQPGNTTEEMDQCSGTKSTETQSLDAGAQGFAEAEEASQDAGYHYVNSIRNWEDVHGLSTS